MSKLDFYLCGAPKEHCNGSLITSTNGLRAVHGHKTPQDAFNCKRRSLLKLGYVQVGAREFKLDDGPILVLTKKSRFGGKMRKGKEKRVMPGQKTTGGVIY